MNVQLASFGNFFAGGDLLLILFIVLLLFGSKKLPELARGMGSAVREFNKAKDELEHELSKPATEVVVQPAQGKLEHQPVAAAAPVAAPANPAAEAGPAVNSPS